MTLVAFITFAGTLAVSAYAIHATIAPRVERILGALRGVPQAEPALEQSL